MKNKMEAILGKSPLSGQLRLTMSVPEGKEDEVVEKLRKVGIRVSVKRW